MMPVKAVIYPLPGFAGLTARQAARFSQQLRAGHGRAVKGLILTFSRRMKETKTGKTAARGAE